MKTSHALISLSLLGLSTLVWSQGDPATNQRIIAVGGPKSNQCTAILHELTHSIGTRLTGSANLERGYQWAMAKFKSFGCSNVHLEQWGEWKVGFQRGKNQSAKMISPWKMDMVFTSPSWTPGTDGPMRGPAVLAPKTMDEFNAVKDKLKGAWVIATTSGVGGGRNPAPPSDVDVAINNAGILGRVLGSRNELVITSGNFNIEWNALPTLRRVTVRKSDFDAINLALNAGRSCELEFNMEQKFLPGPRKHYNVIAEIPGTEKPDEVVIISGHFDSWDGPGSQGALDNGTGTSVALEAARILGKAKAKPKRTIRFILWTGEEQGLFGSRAYVEAHKAEMDKISAVFVDDGGTNYEGGVSCTKEMEPMILESRKSIENMFPEMPFKTQIVTRIPRGGGSDHASFNAVGVPGFFWFETGRSDYNYVHHTQHDRFEFAIPEYLVQSSLNSAVMAFNLACAATLLPRELPPPPSGGN